MKNWSKINGMVDDLGKAVMGVIMNEGYKPDRASNVAELRRQTELEAVNRELRAINRELLEALKQLTRGMWAGEGSTNPRVFGSEVAKARAAIAKAERVKE